MFFKRELATDTQVNVRTFNLRPETMGHFKTMCNFQQELLPPGQQLPLKGCTIEKKLFSCVSIYLNTSHSPH